MKVLIIGAGIGGTCLAHGLQKAGIEYAIFERNAEHAKGMPGYGIHINIFGQEAMKESLPEKNWDQFVEKSTPVGGRAQFFDEHLNVLAVAEGSHIKDGNVIAENRLSISRAELRELLLDGLSCDAKDPCLTVHWGKTFVHYEHLPRNRIRAHFADDTYEDGDILVGADGSNSRVRQQYLPDIRRFEVGVTIIVGRTRLTTAHIRQLPPDLIDGSPNNIVPRSTDWMFTSVWRAPVETTNNTIGEIDTYAVWAYIDATDRYPKGLNGAAGSQLRDFVLSRIETWDPRLTILIAQCEEPSVSVVSLRSMPALPAWTATAVTVLGDAIHNMTPMAGVGANTALRDAQLLTKALRNASTGLQSIPASIEAYEKKMRIYSNEAISISLSNAQKALSNSKIKRMAFRAVLRIAQATPSLMKLLFPSGH